MNEVRTALKRTSIYYLLLLINIIPCSGVIPDRFPFRNLSTVYLLVLSVCLILYYAHRVSPAGRLSKMMKALSVTGFLLILLRGIKYSAVAEVGVLARHVWYLYYLPMLLLPLFLFNIALLVSPTGGARVSGARHIALFLTVVLIASVLTNDLHGQVFIFKPGYENWDGDYTRGWLFYVVSAWQYALCFTALAVLIFKCRVGSSKKNALIILLPVAVGTAMFALLLTGKVPRIGGAPIFEFPETLIFTAAVVLECCMQLGLIPTNSNYGKLFCHFSISAQITDQNGRAVFSSDSAIPLTAEQFALPDGARVGEHTVLRKMPIPGGFGFWRDDMTEEDRLNEELAAAKEDLAEEVALTRLQGELKEKRAMIEERTLTYDAIARRTHRQSQLISQLAKAARASSDRVFRDGCRRRITLLGAYIKRYANLMLLSRQSDEIEAGELGLSASEVLRCLNYCGIPGEYIGDAKGSIPSKAALAVFEAFEILLEENYDRVRGVFVTLTDREDLSFKLTVENLNVLFGEDVEKTLTDAGVRRYVKNEDDVTYICFSFPKGGRAK